MGLTGGFLDGQAPDGVREALEQAREAVQRDSPQVCMGLSFCCAQIQRFLQQARGQAMEAVRNVGQAFGATVASPDHQMTCR